MLLTKPLCYELNLYAMLLTKPLLSLDGIKIWRTSLPEYSKFLYATN